MSGLIKALPEQNLPGQPLNQIPGRMPSLDAVPDGCAFNPRCGYANDRCRREQPGLRPVGGALAACHEAERIAEGLNTETEPS